MTISRRGSPPQWRPPRGSGGWRRRPEPRGAMRCMVLAPIIRASAPAASSLRAASTMTAVAPSQSPAACMAAMGAKSTDQMSQPGGVMAAQAVPGQAVEPLVVDGGALPAHAADQTEGLHGRRRRLRCPHKRAARPSCPDGSPRRDGPGRRPERTSRARRSRRRSRAAPSGGGGSPARSGSTSSSIVPASASMAMMSPSCTRAMGPPSWASGPTWPTHRPRVPPEKRPSVIRATLSPRPWPESAAVVDSISRMPGPPLGPS